VGLENVFVTFSSRMIGSGTDNCVPSLFSYTLCARSWFSTSASADLSWS